MNLREEILREHSKAVTERIMAYVGSDATRFGELMELFFKGEYRVTQRVAWPMSYIASKHPELYEPYFEQAIRFMKEPNVHDSVVRNTLRILQEMAIPEHLQGELVDVCLRYISEPQKPSAIKAFAISTLENICKKHSELASEVKWVLKERIELEKPAFQVRARRFLQHF